MKTTFHQGIVFILMILTGCTSGTSRGAGGTETGTTSAGFRIYGTLSSLDVAPSLTFGKRISSSGTITDVIAVSPETGDTSCETGTVDEDGSFEIEIPDGKPWFIYFLDRSLQEALGNLQSSGMDTFAPVSSSGELDLGTLTVDTETGKVTPDLSLDEIASGLGITSVIAELIGRIDDIASRYLNPDIDNDGELDCEKEEEDFTLDFHVRFQMLLGGAHATISDIIDGFLNDSSTAAEYTSTGVYIAYSTSYDSAETGTVTFVDSQVTTQEAGVVPANTPISDLTQNNYTGHYSFGPNIVNSSELPSGTIVFKFGDKTLTFTDVETPSLEELTTPEGRIFPFVRFNKESSGCTTNCTLSGLSYKWMKKTSTGWTEATQEELDILVVSDGGFISFLVDNDSNQSVGIEIPISSVSGEISWDPSNATLTGVTSAEFEAITTSEICHLGLSYDDKLGMRYFEGIDDAPGTCD